ncbi:ribonuclease P protein component [Meinhardsimonia xiamenensis]|jgi:ribonuclease P protein component|uniref:Ribonuclease P protein component n=1 Tax=Meinhardsimonia xiamenensis TaxID=990712 RepID=A0A1G9EC66_9RHOB|nr:ribonuclease P protein component [Meinhardsimonia xiamenensis]PRX33837.1 ribonuclease P protein component [Meinhardsimonia xiamenensis]SDK73706.1 ribonuclease P protein component [Meinhardsimonia xiamenensis]
MHGPSGTREPVERPAAPCPAASIRVERLKRRADFLRAARAQRRATPGFILQARRRGENEPDEGRIRVGFTASKKVGGAVQRNRAKRRLREIARLELPAHGRPGWDYVLVGRREVTASRDFATMREELRRALEALHRNTREGK